MALKPTIYKAQIELADSDRGVYDSLALTLARHPSETLERMAVRLLAYCLNCGHGLAFTRGLSTADEPDLWQHDDSGELQHWIEVGHPDEPRLRRASGRAPRVSVYAFGPSADTWWQLHGAAVDALPRVAAWRLPWEQVQAVAGLLDRTAQLSVSIVGGTIYLDNGADNASIAPDQLTAAD